METTKTKKSVSVREMGKMLGLKKVDGTPPGTKWRDTTLSVPELAELLGIHSATAYELVKRVHLETTIIDRRIRVKRDSFECWYNSQNRYKKCSERRE